MGFVFREIYPGASYKTGLPDQIFIKKEKEEKAKLLGIPSENYLCCTGFKPIFTI